MNWSEMLKKEIRSSFLAKNFSLASRTTMGIGGTAELYIEPLKSEDIVTIKKVEASEGFRLRVIGGGSNLLIRDGIIPDLFLSTRKLTGIEIGTRNDEYILEVKAGTPVSILLARTGSLSASGLEYLIGIPGTIGGALTGNAGARGYSISRNVEWVETIETTGDIRRWKKNEIEWGYRSSSFINSGRIIVSCGLCVKSAPIDTIRKNRAFFWDMRKEQPYGTKSAGCIFKNPEGLSAGKLLDECGCKGLSIGDASVSLKHANFIVNNGNASFEDVIELIKECRKRVKEARGIDLQLEVRIIDG